jgi:uncharacterized repeat protein (TIGR03803 family)
MASAPLFGTPILSTLASFNSTGGEGPMAAMTLGKDGNFYGTTLQGGITNSSYPYGCGTVFRMTINNGTLTTLVSFSDTNGAAPSAALTLGNDGNFYGTTEEGGSNGVGTVFKVALNGMLTSLVSFNVANGEFPCAALTLGNDGNFYGTTSEGGNYGYGTIFQVTTNGMLTTLVSFSNTNGAAPSGALTLGNDGNFYGTTKMGGSSDDGTVFKVTTNGTLTSLVSFSHTNGSQPFAALTLGTDGNFYGTTGYGGSSPISGYGTVFKVTTNGILTMLFSFDGTVGPYANGELPYGGLTLLTLGNYGIFYGTTYDGGSSGFGTVFLLLLPPVISVQPQSQTNYYGSTAMFTVIATNQLTPVSFQWLTGCCKTG